MTKKHAIHDLLLCIILLGYAVCVELLGNIILIFTMLFSTFLAVDGIVVEGLVLLVVQDLALLVVDKLVLPVVQRLALLAVIDLVLLVLINRFI